MSKILSEKRGVILWLERKGNVIEFAGYILKLYKEQTSISFYTVSLGSLGNEKFLKFTNWYDKQNIVQLKKDWKNYKVEKQKQKELSLEQYYKSDWHQFFIENQDKTVSQLYKKFKNKFRYTDFRDMYKKTKSTLT